MYLTELICFYQATSTIVFLFYRGPKNIDVFSPPNSQECIAEESDQYNKNLRMIRKLLLQVCFRYSNNVI